jgi:Mg2+ and Co2+ transporter CorA
MQASNLPEESLLEIAAATGLPRAMIEAALRNESYPRLESAPPWYALTLAVPALEGAVERYPVLLLASEAGLLTLALYPLELPAPRESDERLPFGTRCALHLARCSLERNNALADRYERELRELEDLPADESPESFFERTFRLKRTLSTAKSDLWRLRGLFDTLAQGRGRLPGIAKEHGVMLREWADEAGHLYETVERCQESLLSLLDLHLNLASHEMNRFMRLLAIVSSLALIPTIVGGLLGMNVEGNPWPVTLGQIAFGTLILMLGVLYAFMAKGWLR